MKIPIRGLDKAFHELLGQLTWSVCKGRGTSLTFEFGEPRITVREAITASAGASEVVIKNLARRRVFITGDWHLYIQNARWEINTRYDLVTSEAFDTISLHDALEEVDGQRLLSVSSCADDGSCILTFDLGASVALRLDASVEDDQRSIHARDGSWINCGADGSVRHGRP